MRSNLVLVGGFPFTTRTRIKRRFTIVSNTAVQALLHVFPQTLILGALSLLDRNAGGALSRLDSELLITRKLVIEYIPTNGRSIILVQGSGASCYTIHTDLGQGRASCSCPAFIHSVLSARTHLLVRLVSSTHMVQNLLTRSITVQTSPSC